jgi:NADH dehydrogenase
MLTLGRRITVFGGSGFVGRHLVRRLAAQGWVVRVATRDPVRAAFLKPMGNVGQVVPMKCNIADEASVDAAVAGAEAVVNLVGILYERGSQKFSAIHAAAPERLARVAARHGVTSLVHVSAIGADPKSDSAYARTKAIGEAGVRTAFPAATVLRPSIQFGPEDGFFNRFARMAMFSPALPLIGGGTTRFQPVYVGDVAEAIMRALTDPAARGKIYELGGPKVYTFKALMEMLLATISRKRWLVPVPFWAAEIKGAVLQYLPVPPLTRDQVKQLRHDNVVASGVPGLADLGITPTAVEVILPTYLDIYRRGGRFAPVRSA